MKKSLLSFLYFGNKSFEISKHIIEDKNLPEKFDNFKIIHLSDFHSNYDIKDKIIQQINKEEPNIVVMTGDMINKYDKKSDFNIFLDLAQNIASRYKTYFICGNHENRLDKEDLNYIYLKLKKYNICILNNDNKKIYIDNQYINIYGINLSNEFYIINNAKKIDMLNNKIEESLTNLNEDQYNIILIHNPLFFNEYVKYNANIIFSGHVHGGMIRLPLVGALLSPERKFFPKYNSGIYEIKNKFMIVSRGLGHSRPGIRLKNKPELVSITFRGKE